MKTTTTTRDLQEWKEERNVYINTLDIKITYCKTCYKTTGNIKLIMSNLFPFILDEEYLHLSVK